MPQRKIAPSDPAIYTKPRLRDRIRKRVIAGTKGGRAGQWSARKAQLVAHAYEAAGGSYKRSRSTAQKNLGRWTEESWTTSDGKPAARGSGMARYLPRRPGIS